MTLRATSPRPRLSYASLISSSAYCRVIISFTFSLPVTTISTKRWKSRRRAERAVQAAEHPRLLLHEQQRIEAGRLILRRHPDELTVPPPGGSS